MNAKIYIGILLVLLSLVMTGCIQPEKPMPSPSPTQNPTITPSPTSTPTPTPQAGRIYLTFDPGQCTDLAQYALTGNKDSIKTYYEENGILIFDVEISNSLPPGTAVCEACYVCASGKSITLQINEKDKERIDAKGQIIPKPDEGIKLDSISKYVCGEYGDETATVQVISPYKFRINAKFQSNCLDFDAYFQQEITKTGKIYYIDFKSKRVDRACMKCMGMDTVETTLDLSMLTIPALGESPSEKILEKIVIRKDGKFISEKAFLNSFCGGIAAFQCAEGYSCVFDGDFPDAGGKCVPEKKGYLTGKLTVGPICPVERPDQPCPIPPEAYTSRKLTATGPDGAEKMMLIDIDTMGYFQVSLLPGKYLIDLQKNGMDRSSELPAEIQILAGKKVELNIDIDTGIR